MQLKEGSVIFYALTVGFAAGIAGATLLPVDQSIILLLLLFALGLMLTSRRKSSAFAALFIPLLSFFLLALALGATRVWYAEMTTPPSPLDARAGNDVVITGAVIREPDVRERSLQLTVDTVDGRVLVRTERHAAIEYGDTITATGTLERPESFTTEFGRTFDYPGYLEARGITHTLSFAEVEVLDTGGGQAYLKTLFAFKHRFMDTIEQLVPEPQAGLSEGLLLGVKQALGEDLEEAFRETGIIHIVVLSGYNVMLVVAFVLYGLSFLLPLRARLIVGLGAIMSFALLVGLSATVVRASIMASLLLLARTFGRTYAILRALMLAGVVMLLINPYLLIYDVGFQLSFMATLGLILLAPAVEDRLFRVPSTFGIREFLTATIVTQLFVSPLLLYQIGQFSLVSVIVNVLVLPMVPVAMLLTFVTGIVGLVSLSLAAPFAFLAYWSLTYIVTISQVFAALPLAAIVVPPFPFSFVVISYGLMGLFLVWYARRSRFIPVISSGHGEWVIEDEELLRARLQEKAGESKMKTSPDSPADIPTFFR